VCVSVRACVFIYLCVLICAFMLCVPVCVCVCVCVCPRCSSLTRSYGPPLRPWAVLYRLRLYQVLALLPPHTYQGNRDDTDDTT
jgi:hypothetical protein